MVGVSIPEAFLLRWSKHLPESDVQDPLGLNLRGAARLGGSLLYCITSITPRARYFSFIPWCVLDFQKNERGKPYATGLREALILREHALTLGCVAHHDGRPCAGGNLVGSDKASGWYTRRSSGNVDLKKLRFVKIPAYRLYFNPLVNLGVFITDEERPEDESGEEEDRTFDDLQLSPLGLELAESYGTAVNGLQVGPQISSLARKCSVPTLKQLGKRGGLCEVTEKTAPDRKLLRDIFFCRKGLKDGSHSMRRQSLLLMLEICQQLSRKKHIFDEDSLAAAVYFGEVLHAQGRLRIRLPGSLENIALRWRMFYFHYYMGVALESLFSWLVSELRTAGLAGRSTDDIVKRLKQKTVRSDLKGVLGHDIGEAFSELSPARLLVPFGVPAGPLAESTSVTLDGAVAIGDPVSERMLEGPLWDREYQQSPTGLAIPMVLLAVTLGRYKRWESTNYGNWLAGFARDPYLDLVPPVLLDGLSRHFGDWWNCRMDELTSYVLSRYVVQHHQAMSYEKTFAGDRCLLHVDGTRITCSGAYGKIAVGSPRFGSALQVLIDLALVAESESDGILRLTTEGQSLLEEELAKEDGK